MEKFTKFLYHSLAVIILSSCISAHPLYQGFYCPFILPVQVSETSSVNFFNTLTDSFAKTKGLRFKGDYFIYSDDINYLFGSGNITLMPDSGNIELAGDVLYLQIGGTSGIIFGNVHIKHKNQNSKVEVDNREPNYYDAVFFNAIPPQWLLIKYTDEIQFSGNIETEPFFMHFEKKTPEMLKDSSLYFEFREFRIDRNRQIKAKYVIPYMMGLPTFPLKHFTVRRGAWSEKTLLSFRNVNYSEVDGLSTAFYFRLREKFIKGDHDIKLYERKLFGLDGESNRGIIFSGKSTFKNKKRNLFEISSLLNSGEESFSLRFEHRMELKLFNYGFSQTISGQTERPTFLEFSTDITINRLKIIIPRFQLSYDLKKSFSYRLSSPINVVKRLNLNVSWGRRTIKDTYHSDNTDFSTSLNFNSTLLSLSSNYSYSKNLIEANVKQNFSINMKLKPILFLMNNVSLDISSFCMISSLPFGEETRSRFSPGLNIGFRSAGALLPLKFKLVPTFSFNHLWDNQDENFTDFNYGLSLQKEIGIFKSSLDYTLASRYRARNFWIEGNNRQNLNFTFEVNDPKNYLFLLRFYCNNQLELEDISFTGQITLPFDLNFSSFLLYYNQENKFQTVEVFLEKTFKKRIKIQGGYSLALKRFFVKFLTL